MQSLIVKELKLRYNPVAIFFTDERPDKAHQYREEKWGCAMALYNITMKLGKPAAFDRKTYGCIGAGVGLCLGNTYFGNREFMENLLHDRERYFKNRELVDDFLDNIDYQDIPENYVVFRPLEDIDQVKEKPAIVSLPANADQLSALVVLANYRRKGIESVAVPFCAGCQSVCLFPKIESKKEVPRAIIGNIDISSRRVLPADILTFSVPFGMFLEMEEDLPGSFIRTEQWERITKRIPDKTE